MFITVASIDRKTAKARTVTIECVAGTTAAEAARKAGFEPSAIEGWAVWNRRCEAEHVLEDGDRLDLGAPLRIDAKEARAQRAVSKDHNAQRSLPRHGGRHQLVKPLSE